MCSETIIKTNINFGFQWFEKNLIYFKGFFFNRQNELLDKESAFQYFANAQTFSEFKNLVTAANGQFCIIINKNDETWVAVDRLRSLPLFYYYHYDRWLITDQTELLLYKTNSKIKIINQTEFVATSFVIGKETLLDGVNQLQASECICFYKKSFKSERYFNILCTQTKSLNTLQFENDFFKQIKLLGEKLILFLNGRTALVPLSGGYDSRLITYLLKIYNYNKVLCFTYGRENNSEKNNACRTAEKLGFRWVFINYELLKLKEFFDDGVFENYYQFMANHSSMFFMQEYFAVKYLKENKIIPEESVFIPGHGGDFIAGSHLYQSLQNINRHKLVKDILYKHCSLVTISRKEKNELKKRIEKHIPVGFLEYSIYDNFNLLERQAKFITNSARIFDFFGYQYYMPLWNESWMNFFADLPFDLKLYKRFYNKMVQKLFSEFDINFSQELQSSPYTYQVQHLKNILLSIFSNLKRLKKSIELDPICYNEITSAMWKAMQNKGFKTLRPLSYNGIIVQWYICKLLDKI